MSGLEIEGKDNVAVAVPGTLQDTLYLRCGK